MQNTGNIRQWAYERGLLKKENSLAQFTKIIEEVSEVGNAIIKDDREALIDGIGDSFVTLIILAAQNDLDPVDCLNSAWDQIKNRSGKTENGVFFKDK